MNRLVRVVGITSSDDMAGTVSRAHAKLSGVKDLPLVPGVIPAHAVVLTRARADARAGG